jgi:hypothetical protein
MNPGHILTLPEGQRFDDEQTQKFLDDLKEKYSGLGRSHKVLVLPTGMNVNQVGIPPEDAQYIESRRFQIEEIARIYRVPLHMIGETTKNTSWGTGIESMTLGFVTYTLRPWLTRIEQALEKKLLPESERSDYFVEFLIEDLLRGDQAARSQYYTLAIQNGWMSRNEVRVIENMNPVDGGNDFLVPLNMSVVGEEPKLPAPAPEPEPEEEPRSKCQHLPTSVDTSCKSVVDKRGIGRSRQAIQKSYVGVLEDVYARLLRREKHDVMRGVEAIIGKRAQTELGQWLNDFYEKYASVSRRELRPALRALAEAVGSQAMLEVGSEFQFFDELSTFVEEYVDLAGRRYTGMQLAELMRLMDDVMTESGELAVIDAFEARFKEWELGTGVEGGRAATRARYEATRLGNAFAREAWKQAGHTTLWWAATGDKTCPMCDHLDGRMITGDEDFMGPGDSIGDFSPRTTVAHPPLHAGCDCIIVAGS